MQPDEPYREEHGPCEEYERGGLSEVPDDCANTDDQPCKWLSTEKNDEALLAAKALAHLPHFALALGAAQLWPEHGVGDVRNVHVMANVQVQPPPQAAGWNLGLALDHAFQRADKCIN